MSFTINIYYKGQNGSARKFVNEMSRLGTNIDLIEVSREESVDIDNYEDWWID